MINKQQPKFYEKLCNNEDSVDQNKNYIAEIFIHNKTILYAEILASKMFHIMQFIR